MASLRSEIGPLSSLFALEAAGRLGSFTRAAAELGVTQAAVSKQITGLEARLGTALFERRARDVVLNKAGQALFATTSTALTSIARGIRAVQSPKSHPLTIGLSLAMSQFWLMPILPDFMERHPEIALRVMSQDDLNAISGADIVIRFESVAPPGGIRLFGAEITAMASPRFVALNRLTTADDVIQATLLRYDTPDPSWVTWQDWAKLAAVDLAQSQRTISFNRYQDALIAASRDQGVVLAWSFADDPPLAGGSLVPVPGPKIAAAGAFYLHIINPETAGVQEVTEWLKGRGMAAE